MREGGDVSVYYCVPGLAQRKLNDFQAWVQNCDISLGSTKAIQTKGTLRENKMELKNKGTFTESVCLTDMTQNNPP